MSLFTLVYHTYGPGRFAKLYNDKICKILDNFYALGNNWYRNTLTVLTINAVLGQFQVQTHMKI